MEQFFAKNFDFLREIAKICEKSGFFADFPNFSQIFLILRRLWRFFADFANSSQIFPILREESVFFAKKQVITNYNEPFAINMKSSTRSVLVGAAFLMATSAIGPGFITQT